MGSIVAKISQEVRAKEQPNLHTEQADLFFDNTTKHVSQMQGETQLLEESLP
ncbi:hypothetical protein Syun_004247 [Stephania yunnanensis]|uniref:Uncharacterized protein n=1 Tax=Stephania yunnanensis TaxID=152371 RepID=A0AAP0Q197_9MAGN